MIGHVASVKGTSMRSMRSTLRIGGLAAVVSATTLVLPLLAIGAAQAAAPADLSITKTVATTAPPVTFVPELTDVRNGATTTFGPAGLTIRTTGTADKAAQYWAQSGPIPSSASMSWTQEQGIFMPGMQILFDTDGILGNGVGDWNILVNVPSDNGTSWWLTPSSSAIAKAAAPSCNNPGPACVGIVNGYQWHGTLPAWVAALGPNAQVFAVGFSLGSGASGVNSGVLSQMTYGSHHYDLTRHYSSAMQAAPGETVEYKITIANSGGPASGITITDVLPADLTYVAGSLSRPDWCSVTGKTLSCTGGVLPTGTSSDVLFKARVSNTATSNGLQPSVGHHVDVQKQEVFANLPANGQPQTFNVMCPVGYTPTDGGLLVDAVDQGGFYSDITTSVSKPTTVAGVPGWTVTATNLGEERGQGKVKVTCLAGATGSSDGHTHAIEVGGSTPGVGTIAATAGTDTVTRACPAGYTPIAPQFEVTSGIAVMRASIATGSSWTWTVDHEAGTAVTFGLSCLAPQAQASNGHTADLGVSTQSDTISLAPESRDEGVLQCLPQSKAITGGHEGMHESVLSLGKEQRGNNYMFRFVNDDWDLSHNAGIQVTCVGDRTPDEPRYYHVRNTATVHSPDDPTNSSSTADISVVGDPVLPTDSVSVGPNGSRTGWPVKKVNLTFTCTSACTFTVRVIKNDEVVAKATKSFGASPNPRVGVPIPTTSAGKNLSAGQVTVKVKTGDGTITRTVTLS